jgi:hypothetical protein
MMHGNQKYKYSIIARRKCWNINTNQSLSLKKKKLYNDYLLFNVKWAGRAILMDHLGSPSFYSLVRAPQCLVSRKCYSYRSPNEGEPRWSIRIALPAHQTLRCTNQTIKRGWTQVIHKNRTSCSPNIEWAGRAILMDHLGSSSFYSLVRAPQCLVSRKSYSYRSPGFTLVL